MELLARAPYLFFDGEQVGIAFRKMSILQRFRAIEACTLNFYYRWIGDFYFRPKLFLLSLELSSLSDAWTSEMPWATC